MSTRTANDENARARFDNAQDNLKDAGTNLKKGTKDKLGIDDREKPKDKGDRFLDDFKDKMHDVGQNLKEGAKDIKDSAKHKMGIDRDDHEHLKEKEEKYKSQLDQDRRDLEAKQRDYEEKLDTKKEEIKDKEAREFRAKAKDEKEKLHDDKERMKDKLSGERSTLHRDERTDLSRDSDQPTMMDNVEQGVANTVAYVQDTAQAAGDWIAETLGGRDPEDKVNKRDKV
jgi:hypothetical protein